MASRVLCFSSRCISQSVPLAVPFWKYNGVNVRPVSLQKLQDENYLFASSLMYFEVDVVKLTWLLYFFAYLKNFIN